MSTYSQLEALEACSPALLGCYFEASVLAEHHRRCQQAIGCGWLAGLALNLDNLTEAATARPLEPIADLRADRSDVKAIGAMVAANEVAAATTAGEDLIDAAGRADRALLRKGWRWIMQWARCVWLSFAAALATILAAARDTEEALAESLPADTTATELGLPPPLRALARSPHRPRAPGLPLLQLDCGHVS